MELNKNALEEIRTSADHIVCVLRKLRMRPELMEELDGLLPEAENIINITNDLLQPASFLDGIANLMSAFK